VVSLNVLPYFVALEVPKGAHGVPCAHDQISEQMLARHGDRIAGIDEVDELAQLVARSLRRPDGVV